MSLPLAAGAEETIEVTITRDHEGTAGLAICWDRWHVRVAKVDPDGPAYRAGMRECHVYWFITRVDGLDVTTENVQAAMDATRAPDRTFTIRVRRPYKAAAAPTGHVAAPPAQRRAGRSSSPRPAAAAALRAAQRLAAGLPPTSPRRPDPADVEAAATAVIVVADVVVGASGSEEALGELGRLEGEPGPIDTGARERPCSTALAPESPDGHAGAAVVEEASPQKLRAYLVDNSALKARERGLAIRKSKNIADKDGRKLVVWNTIVNGIEESGGWVKVGDAFLPMELRGVMVMKLIQEDDAPQGANARAREHAAGPRGAEAACCLGFVAKVLGQEGASPSRTLQKPHPDSAADSVADGLIGG